MSIKVDFTYLDPATKPYKLLNKLDKISLINDSLNAKPCSACEDRFFKKMSPQNEERCAECSSSMRQRWQVERRMQNIRPYLESIKNEDWYKRLAKRMVDSILYGTPINE